MKRYKNIMKSMFRGLKALIIIFSFVNLHQPVLAQVSKLLSFSPEEGFHVTSQNKKYDIKLGLRFQEQAFVTTPVSNGEVTSSDMMMRRARAQIGGYLFSTRHTYFIQFDYDNKNYQLSNFEYRLRPNSNIEINIGQLMPPTGRQWQTISKNFQMVDRSIVSRYFAVGYDQGVSIRYRHNLINKSKIKFAAGITHGEGINRHISPGGLAYSGRIDILPFGFFHSKGDYVESDFYREPTPKVSLGAAFYHNKDADTKMGFSDLDLMDNNITSYYLDAVVKYNGFSMIGEFIKRETSSERVEMGGDEAFRYSAMNGGYGFSLQVGKFLEQHLEATSRISFLNPDNIIMEAKNSFTSKDKYSVGLSYYVIGHSLKIQSEVSFVEEDFTNQDPFKYFEFLMQFSLSF